MKSFIRVQDLVLLFRNNRKFLVDMRSLVNSLFFRKQMNPQIILQLKKSVYATV